MGQMGRMGAMSGAGRAGPIETGWTQAPGLIAAVMASKRAEGGAGPGVVGVTGAPGSGKSLLAGLIAACAPGSIVLSTDHYLPDYSGLERHEYDLPERADLGLLAEHVAGLQRGDRVERPVWSFATHRRVGVVGLAPPASGGLIVVEGIHALAARVRGLIEVGVYVESPASVRLGRVVARELAGERGWTATEAGAFLREVADPTFAAWADGYRGGADVIVHNPV